jgi:hypothetical protein
MKPRERWPEKIWEPMMWIDTFTFAVREHRKIAKKKNKKKKKKKKNNNNNNKNNKKR